MPTPEPDTGTSASLLVRVRDAADADAWRTFEAVYGPLVRRSCVRRGLQHADAADVSQEVLARVATAIRGFEYAPDKGRFRAWLNTVTANAVRSFRMKAARRPVSVEHEPEAADPSWDADFTAHLLAVACDRVRGEFEPTTWAAFEAAWVRNEPPAEIAGRLGVAVHAVYVNKSRVLKRLEAEVRLLADDLPAAG